MYRFYYSVGFGYELFVSDEGNMENCAGKESGVFFWHSSANYVIKKMYLN